MDRLKQERVDDRALISCMTHDDVYNLFLMHEGQTWHGCLEPCRATDLVEYCFVTCALHALDRK